MQASYALDRFSIPVHGARDSPVFIVKRDGRKEDMLLDKITSRIKKLCYGLDKRFVDPAAITLKVHGSLTPTEPPDLTPHYHMFVWIYPFEWLNT